MNNQEQELFQCDWCGKQYPHVKDHSGLCAKQPVDEVKTHKSKPSHRSASLAPPSGVYMSSACRNRHHPNCKDAACTCKHHQKPEVDQINSVQVDKEIKAVRVINQGEGYMSTACRNRHHPRCKNEACTCKHHVK